MLLPSCFTSGDSPTTLTPSDFLFLISLRSREGVSGARIISVTKNKSIRYTDMNKLFEITRCFVGRVEF